MQELGLKRRGTAMNENELLADVATKVADMYDAALADPSPPSGAAFGERVANMLAEDWGGINIYIPKGKNRRLRQRNAQLWQSSQVTTFPNWHANSAFPNSEPMPSSPKNEPVAGYGRARCPAYPWTFPTCVKRKILRFRLTAEKEDFLCSNVFFPPVAGWPCAA